MPPDVALLVPEAGDGGLPALKPLELPVLEPPEPLELFGLGLAAGLEAREGLALCEWLGLWEGLAAGLARWVPGASAGRETPGPEPTPAVCRVAPGRTNAVAPVAATPPAPIRAVRNRTIDRP